MKRSFLLALTMSALPGLAMAQGGARPDSRSDRGAAVTRASLSGAPTPLKVAVLELAVVDNSLYGNSDSLRAWMVEAGIEPTRLLREALSREETYTALSPPRPELVAIPGPQVEAALAEAGYAAGECIRIECTTRIGRTLGADRVITGEVTKLSGLIWFVTARVIDVGSGKALRQDEFEVKGVITDLMPKVMASLARRLAAA